MRKELLWSVHEPPTPPKVGSIEIGGMLDERDDSVPQSPYDHNNYILGRVGPHNVAIVCARRNDGLDVCDKDGQSDALGLYSLEVRVSGGYWRRCAKQRE
jgi:hypothetical protein